MNKTQSTQYVPSFLAKSLHKTAREAGSYVPPASVVLRGLGINSADLREERVYVSSNYLRFLISKLAEAATFDEEWYLQSNPDVQGALLAGDVKSPKAHFIASGYLEGRLPSDIPCDTKWYFDHYKDLAQVFNSSETDALKKHYQGRGYFEGRAGTALDLPEAERWSRGETVG